MDIGLWIWLGFGAVVGSIAARRRGFSLALGLIGGLLLGLLSPLLFLVPGKRQKCPHCAEWVKIEAKVCPHCQRQIAGDAPQPAPEGADSGSTTG
jgi:hypothetical protein